jgi:hypothetical protein
MVLARETPAHETDPVHDFDFLNGTWNAHHRRLKERLSGCTEWDEFDGTATVRPLWGGAAQIDEVTGDGPAGHFEGVTLRLFDPVAHHWSLYWANREHGVLTVPTIGRFRDGRGEFYDHEVFEGKAVFVRFLWTAITPDSCRWEQAFSQDGGQTWETNWIVDLTRAR